MSGRRPRDAGRLAPDEQRPTVTLCADGPMLVRGEVVLEDADGVRHTSTRPVTAICRCDKSSRAPWCDGTHKLLKSPARRSG